MFALHWPQLTLLMNAAGGSDGWNDAAAVRGGGTGAAGPGWRRRRPGDEHSGSAKQNGLPFLPQMVMEAQKLIEKHAADSVWPA